MSTREVDRRGEGGRRAFIAPVPAFVDDNEESSDKVLTVAFKSGEKGAYQAIHDRYSHRVHGVCRRMLLHPEDAEEAAQESFLRVYQALGRFNGRYLLGPWITRITTNVCLDHLRARGRRPVDLMPVEILDVHGHVDDNLDPQEIHVRRTEGRRVHKLLESLPPVYRAAIVLRDFEGLSYAEVATALEITEPQTKALIHRARQAFKRSWSSALIALPLRFMHKLRRVDAGAREQRGHAAASIQQTTEVMGSAAQVASSCSTMLQQCGHLFTERFVAAGAALAIGTAAAAGGAVLTDRSLAGPPAVEMAASAGVATAGAKSEVAAAPRHRKADAAALPSETDVPKPEATAIVVEPTEAPPPPDEAPADEEGQVPPVEGDPGAQEPAPAPTPSESPAPPEPDGFAFGIDAITAATPEACSCMQATTVQSESLRATAEGIDHLDQVVSGHASANGTPVYGAWLDHSSDERGLHSMELRLYADEGGYFYNGSGWLIARASTEWGGWEYTYSGTYQLTSRPGSADAMPKDGTYDVVVQVSHKHNRVVATSLTLREGNS